MELNREQLAILDHTAPTMVTDAGCMFALAAAMDLAKLCDTLEARANKEL